INVSVTPRTGALLDFEKRGLPEMIRSSVHYLTSDEEITRLCDALQRL
ncbi:MAG: aminotransferase, partial [Bacteroidetes bacterium]